ncbi:MAG: hypothetical protein LBT11_03455 [Treponema sp.]|jgi:hypothetical protein|nr:hypothetical protein [Treponema sp.]
MMDGIIENLIENLKVIDSIGIKINNLALKDEVCCSGKVLDSGVNTQDYALKLPRVSEFLGIKPFANNKVKAAAPSVGRLLESSPPMAYSKGGK